MADFELLAPGGHQKLVDEVVDRLDLKADIDGYYAQLTAGAADNLTARGDAVEASFIRRTSGGISDIESGNATIESIKGNTIRWNQLITDGDVERTGVLAGNYMNVRYTNTTEGKVAGHKYLFMMHAYADAQYPAQLTMTDNVNETQFSNITIGSSYGMHAAILTAGYSHDYVTFSLRILTSHGITELHTKNAVAFDLTQMFGAGSEPSTVAEFEALYPLPYYEYDAGSLLPVTMTGIATDGFNQWDEEWEFGQINNGGNSGTSGTRIRSKNYIPVFPSTEYYVNLHLNSNGFKLVLYDAGKTFISESWLANNLFTTPANCRYIRFCTGDGYGSVYNNDICINLSWSGRRNGEYEPYWKAERLIALGTHFPTGLKKAGSVYDELTATETVQRVGVVDLGTLTWIVAATGSTGQYRMVSNGLRSLALKPASNAVLADITCQKYDAHTSTEVYQLNVGICIDATGDIVVYDPNYATQDSAAAFKTAMSGVILYYALATPTTTAIDPALNLTYKADDWGTESVMVPSATVSAVPTFGIIYGMNAVDTIRRLPDLYAGKAETEAALAGKADVDGYYSQMTVGAADNLTGRGDTTTAEFLYRTAGGTADIETGQAVAKSIKGNTLVWNQLYNKSTVATTTTNGITFTVNADGSITASGTATADTEFFLITNRSFDAHKYLVSGCPSGGSNGTYSVRMRGAGSDAIDTGSGVIWDATGNTWKSMQIRVYNGTTIDSLVFRPQLFDLTQMFGAGNEPSTVAEFEALFPESYYEYDAGSLLSVNMTGIETTGFNQWDEQWELGFIGSSDGQAKSATDKIRSKNYIPVIGGQTYYIKGPYGTMACYDGNKGYIGNVPYRNATVSGQYYLDMPANACYVRFSMGASYGTTYKGDICVNLSWSGRRNGEYEPYWSAQREIAAATYFPDGMRSAGSIYDELTATEAIQRVGVVDLGTLTWELAPTAVSGTNYFVNTEVRNMTGGIARPADNSTVGVLICSKYDSVTANNTYLTNKVGISIETSGRVTVYDPTYTAAAAFKTAMSGVYLFYALAEPTVTPIDPPLNLSYRVDDFGTERVMVPEDERSAPPVLDIAYGLNVVDFVRRAPTQYVSAASFAQYLLARDAHDGTTTTMTWDDTDNRYEFTITDTVTEG